VTLSSLEHTIIWVLLYIQEHPKDVENLLKFCLPMTDFELFWFTLLDYQGFTDTPGCNANPTN
jgi:hypothetical protein